MLPASLLRRIPQVKPTSSVPTPLPVAEDAMDMSVFPEDGPDIYDPETPNDFVLAIKERDRMEKHERIRVEREKLEKKQRDLHHLLEQRDIQGLNPDGSPKTESTTSSVNVDESLEEMLRRRRTLTGFSLSTSPSVYLLIFHLVLFQRNMKNTDVLQPEPKLRLRRPLPRST